MAMEILFIEFHDFWLLLDRIVATNGIKASNPPLTTAIFDYIAQIGKCYKYRLSLSWHKPIYHKAGNSDCARSDKR